MMTQAWRMVVIALALTVVFWAPASAQVAYQTIIQATWVVVADSDGNAFNRVRFALEGLYPGAVVQEVDSRVSAVQAIPGSTTFDVTVTMVTEQVEPSLLAATSSVSVTSLTLKDGTALLKGGSRVTGTVEVVPPICEGC